MTPVILDIGYENCPQTIKFLHLWNRYAIDYPVVVEGDCRYDGVFQSKHVKIMIPYDKIQEEDKVYIIIGRR